MFYNFKRQAAFIIIVLSICNIIPTCAGYKTEITRSFAMTADCALPKIISYFPQSISNGERIFVNVIGRGFEKGSRLIIKGFVVGKRYMKVVDSGSLIVKVPKGVPAGKYPVLIENPDGSVSNEVWFEVRS